MKKLLTMIGAAAVAAGAYAAVETIEIDGVTWTYAVNSSANKTITLGGGTGDLPAMTTDTALDAADIPWTMEIGGDTYTVSKIAVKAFNGCGNLTGTLTIPDGVTVIGGSAFNGCSNLTGRLTIPDGVTQIGDLAFNRCSFGGTVVVPSSVTQISAANNGTFCNNSNLEAIWIKGRPTVENQDYTKVYPHAFAQSCTSLKMVLMGRHTKNFRDNAQPLAYVSGVDWFEPANFEDDTYKLNLGDNRLWKYGPGEEFDLEIDDVKMTATFTPTTEAALTNVLSWASSFKTHFGLDTVVSITNSIAVTEGAVTPEMLQNVKLDSPSWFMTFAVKTQAQLNTVLAAVDGPIVADITGAREEITVPAGRQVAILVPGGATFNYHKRGLIISFY